MKRAFSGRFAILFSTALTVASFQNCAKVSFESSLPGGVSLSSLGDKGTVQLLTCDFNGKTVSSGDAEVAFRSATVPFGAVCESENRVCTNGQLSGTFTQTTCVVDQPASCSLRGVAVAHGASIETYLSSSVPYGGTCQSQTRTCSNGVLSGTFGETTCAPVSPLNCEFNDVTVLHGQAQTAYESSRVAFGASCVSQSRVCSNGVLSGTYGASTCVVDQPRSCSIKGVTVRHGDTVKAYLASAVAYGESCQSQDRVCSNGTLSGAYGEVACEVGAPVNCAFNDTTVLHGQAQTAYESSRVAFGASCVSQSRVCSNGTLSGSYRESSCVVDGPLSCTLKGVTINHGETVRAFAASSVAFGATCTSETRSCSNGVLSGKYGEVACAPVDPRSCSFNSRTVAHGNGQVAYRSASVPYGATCESENRICTDGTLSGSFTNSVCAVGLPEPCSLSGARIPSGETITAYEAESVPFGSTCRSQPRSCLNGTLSGTFTKTSCEALPPATCSLDGRTVAHGASGDFFVSRTVPYGQTCKNSSRTCYNGVLNGSTGATFASCEVDRPLSCTLKGVTINHGETVRAFAASSVAFGATCTSETRSCSNGVLSGTYSEVACAPADPRSCSFNSRTVAHGNAQVAYRSASVPYGATCESENRTCTDGTLSGSFTNAACVVGSPEPCSLSGTQVPSGGAITAYESDSVPFGSTCRSQQRSCLNGALSGTFTKTSCQALPPATCSLDGRTVAHGASGDFFVSRTVPYGQTCIRTPRTCSNGVLNGAAEAVYASCEVGPAPPPPPAPVCEPALGCADMASTVAAGGNPVIQFAGQSATRSVSASGQYSCQGPVRVTAVSNSFIGVANVVAAAIGDVSAVGATSVSLNANSVGDVGSMSVASDLSITTRDLGSISSFGSKNTCVSAQKIGTITGNGGSNIALYGRAEGGVRSTIQSLTNFDGKTALVSNFDVKSPVSGNGNAALTFVNSKIPSFTQLAVSLHLNASTVTGDISNSNLTGGLRLTNGAQVNGTIYQVATSTLTISGGSVVQRVGSGFSGRIVLDGGFINEAAWDGSVQITCRNGGKVRRDLLPWARVPASCL